MVRRRRDNGQRGEGPGRTCVRRGSLRGPIGGKDDAVALEDSGKRNCWIFSDYWIIMMYILCWFQALA